MDPNELYSEIELLYEKPYRARPVGEIHLKNPDQYVKDKLKMLVMDFHIMPTLNDVIFMCKNAANTHAIDCRCQAIILRGWGEC